MNGEEKEVIEDVATDEGESNELGTDTIVMEDISDIDNVGDISVEINVEELVAKVESGEGDAEEHRKELHKRLNDLEEQRLRDKELEGTYNFNLDEDL